LRAPPVAEEASKKEWLQLVFLERKREQKNLVATGRATERMQNEK